MQLIDKHILEEPTAGVLTMQSMLKDVGIHCSYERVRRLMRKSNIRAIYPRKHLAVLGEKIYVYLLRHLEITRFRSGRKASTELAACINLVVFELSVCSIRNGSKK
jgi:hypothetical protein